jgi:S-ribosylhomocysteine lyase LuxS involved in autoinducer biosynthesis
MYKFTNSLLEQSATIIIAEEWDKQAANTELLHRYSKRMQNKPVIKPDPTNRLKHVQATIIRKRANKATKVEQ